MSWTKIGSRFRGHVEYISDLSRRRDSSARRTGIYRCLQYSRCIVDVCVLQVNSWCENTSEIISLYLPFVIWVSFTYSSKMTWRVILNFSTYFGSLLSKFFFFGMESHSKIWKLSQFWKKRETQFSVFKRWLFRVTLKVLESRRIKIWDWTRKIQIANGENKNMISQEELN